MMRRIMIGLAAMSTALVGCGPEGKLAVRAIPSPLAAGDLPASERVAEANGQYALGNVGLALEAYRKAMRDQPDDVQALAGMARCYDRMGRPDLSRQYYEAALAIAPRSPVLLEALARSLDLQGEAVEAARVRGEIRLAIADDPALAPLAGPAVTERVELSAPVVTLSAAMPMILPPVAETVSVAVSAAPAASPMAKTAPVAVAAVAAAQPIMVAVPKPAPMIATSLPVVAPPRPMPAQVVAVAAPAPSLLPVALASAFTAGRIRLERMSDHVVALVTRGGPSFAAPRAIAPGAAVRASLTVDLPRRSQLAVLTVERGPVLLLNAARVQGIAARTRLNVPGLARATIGNAPQSMAHSLILYGRADRARALKLAAATGVEARALRWKPAGVTMLLGRDWRRARA